jgi:hypothetical protein
LKFERSGVVHNFSEKIDRGYNLKKDYYYLGSALSPSTSIGAAADIESGSHVNGES